MNTSGEVADLMVKEGLQITEEVVKLTGLGAKNLAAIVIALLKEDNKLQGETNLKKLLKSDKKLCILQIKEDDIKKFNQAAKKYGVLFTVVKDNENGSGLCDIIAKQEDVTQLNYIMEKLGYAAPTEEIEPEPEKETDKAADKTEANPAREEELKKASPRAKENQQEKESMKHGDTDGTGNRINKKPSVRKKIEDIKKENKKAPKKEPEKGKNPYMITAPTNKKKKSKKKSKGYDVKVFNLITPHNSDGYNPFTYVRNDEDVIKLITNLIQNTTPKNASQNDPFWEKSEIALDTALMLYLLHEAPPEEQTFEMLMFMIENAAAMEDDDEYQSPVDMLFDALEDENPEHIALKQYKIFKQASGVVCSKRLLNHMIWKSLRTHNFTYRRKETKL